MSGHEYRVVTFSGPILVVDSENGLPISGDDPLSYERRMVAEGWEPYECIGNEWPEIIAGVDWDTARIRDELGRRNAGARSVYRRLVA